MQSYATFTPSANGTYTIRATSVLDSSKSATINVQVKSYVLAYWRGDPPLYYTSPITVSSGENAGFIITLASNTVWAGEITWIRPNGMGGELFNWILGTSPGSSNFSMRAGIQSLSSNSASENDRHASVYNINSNGTPNVDDGTLLQKITTANTYTSWFTMSTAKGVYYMCKNHSGSMRGILEVRDNLTSDVNTLYLDIN
jgi:hypothetical protein